MHDGLTEVMPHSAARVTHDFFIAASALASSHGHKACTESDMSLPFCVIEGVRRTSPMHLAARLAIRSSFILYSSCVIAVFPGAESGNPEELRGASRSALHCCCASCQLRNPETKLQKGEYTFESNCETSDTPEQSLQEIIS